jgi:hypothetical protein
MGGHIGCSLNAEFSLYISPYCEDRLSVNRNKSQNEPFIVLTQKLNQTSQNDAIYSLLRRLVHLSVFASADSPMHHVPLDLI